MGLFGFGIKNSRAEIRAKEQARAQAEEQAEARTKAQIRARAKAQAEEQAEKQAAEEALYESADANASNFINAWTGAPYDRSKPNINIGTIGQAGHGKTMLTTALARYLGNAGVSPASLDASDDEKELEATIRPSWCDYETPGRHYTHIDCPGNPGRAKGVIRAVSMMDCAILVISAVDGVMPQTVEYARLAKQAGVSKLVIFISKADMTDCAFPDDIIETEIEATLAPVGFDDCPVIRGSALRALEGESDGIDSIAELVRTIEEYVPVPARDADGPFLMRVQKALPAPNGGVTAVGRVMRGRASVGDEVEALGLKPPAVAAVSDIMICGKKSASAEAGDCAAILLSGTSAPEIVSGRILAAPGTVKTHTRFECGLEFLYSGRDSAPLQSGFTGKFFFGTQDANGAAALADGRQCAGPGDRVRAEVTLQKPVVLEAHDTFSVRLDGYTAAAGTVTGIKT